MTRSAYFMIRESTRPVGGTNVIYGLAAMMANAGIPSAILLPSPRRHYRYATDSVDAFYSRSFRRALSDAQPSRRARLQGLVAAVKREGKAIPPADVGPRDIVIVPEFMMDLGAKAYPDNPKVMLSQNPFAHLRGLANGIAERPDLAASYEANIGISEICMETLAITKARNRHFVPVYLEPEVFAFGEEKKLQIAYMPRKRRGEVRVVVELMRNDPAFRDVEFVSIDAKPQAEVARILHESLMFLSFSEQEGFGLPPAEAMLSGCLVVGYTGHGGDEFFTEEGGFPVADGQIMEVYERARDVIGRWRTDPEPLDRMRRRARETLVARYSRTRTREALLHAWESIEKAIDASENTVNTRRSGS